MGILDGLNSGLNSAANSLSERSFSYNRQYIKQYGNSILSPEARATQKLQKELESEGKGLAAAEMGVAVAYKARQGFLDVIDIKQEYQAYLKTLSKDQRKKLKADGNDVPAEFLAQMAKDGKSIQKVATALKSGTSLDKLKEMIEWTFKKELIAKERVKLYIDWLAWFIQDNKESLKLSSPQAA